MNEAPLELLFAIVLGLLFVSAFFSGSETGMMSLNRYRLKHLTNKGDRNALRVAALLRRPDRLLGLILIGNNLVNVFAASVATIIGMRLFGDAGVALAGILLTLAMLVFAEVTPKTVAALHPERVAFAASWVLRPLSYVLHPFVLLVNGISNGITKLVGIDAKAHKHVEHLDPDELRTVVDEAGDLIPDQHQGMLLNVLDLEKSTVEDIMIPRSEVVGLNLEDSVSELLEQIRTSEYTRLPVYEGDLNNVVGLLHLRKAARIIRGEDDTVTHQAIREEISEPYFVPESTKLHTQLFNFQQQKSRMALVVDEYGEVQGIVTLEDLLEEIVGDFTTNSAEEDAEDILPQDDGSYLIDGGTFIRDINRALNWELPTDGPKTLNGLAMEILENIPDGNIGFIVAGYYIETTEISDKMISWLRVSVTEREHDPDNEEDG
ncbi:HlyC/CorC family transporter [Marinimicrobium alkaliphilum]|uniref:HlyC/CorC family transporter n=1 Tax=Marinimicrobium alkaliphilum TaxID=2202654 RepID=UPI000DB97100|nr:HlyC/CorC family transporter [Marinimicrobium alkaliphilum]